MKIALAGQGAETLMPIVEELGLEIDETQPDVVISYGGDGTLLGAERTWPGIPKVAIRHARACRKCPDHEDAVVLKRLANGELAQTVLMKLEATAKGQRLVGINDITLHKAVPTSGVRYRVWIDDEPYSNEIVADGMVVATPFGSSAYYRSITRSFFRSGIGVAFNNSTEQVDHLVLRETERLRILVARGPALLCADNDPNMVKLEQGDQALVAKADEWAILLGADTLFCNKCRRLDGTPFNRLGGLSHL